MDDTSNFQNEIGAARRPFIVRYAPEKRNMPCLQLFTAVPAVYVALPDLAAAAGAQQVDHRLALQLPEPGLETIDLLHLFQQPVGVRGGAGVGGVQQLAQLPETGVDLRMEVCDLQLPLGGVRQLFGSQTHGADSVPKQFLRFGTIWTLLAAQGRCIQVSGTYFA